MQPPPVSTRRPLAHQSTYIHQLNFRLIRAGGRGEAFHKVLWRNNGQPEAERVQNLALHVQDLQRQGVNRASGTTVSDCLAASAVNAAINTTYVTIATLQPHDDGMGAMTAEHAPAAQRRRTSSRVYVLSEMYTNSSTGGA